MKGIPHSSSKVIGPLQKKTMEIYHYKIQEDNMTANDFLPIQRSQVIEKLRDGQLRLNGLVGMLDKMGYQLNIEIIKK